MASTARRVIRRLQHKVVVDGREPGEDGRERGEGGRGPGEDSEAALPEAADLPRLFHDIVEMGQEVAAPRTH
eukprot:12915244-Prorocentrum_lima.AAC.1